MRKRDLARTRRPPRRPQHDTYLVVIGAERTESAYLKGLRDHFELRTVALKVVEKPCAPDQLVEYTRDSFRLADYDQIWCVTDVDHYEREGGKVSAAAALAATCGIRLALSNPCFELWLLLHHESCAGYCATCAVVERRLLKRLPRYDKTRLRFGDFVDGLDDAVKRAKTLDAGGNPSTSMWELVTAILEKE